MGAVAWYALCLLAGIALDWAFVDRFSTIFEVFIKRSATLGYRDGLFPRIIFTALAAIFFAYGSVNGSPPNMVFYVGVALFLLSLTWGLFIAFRDNGTGV
jgi:hypothetical protein